MIRKLFCTIIFIISSAIIVLYFLTLNKLGNALGLDFNFEDLYGLITSLNNPSSLSILSLAVHAFLGIFGIPFLLFTTSLIGLTLPPKK